MIITAVSSSDDDNIYSQYRHAYRANMNAVHGATSGSVPVRSLAVNLTSRVTEGMKQVIARG